MTAVLLPDQIQTVRRNDGRKLEARGVIILTAVLQHLLAFLIGEHDPASGVDENHVGRLFGEISELFLRFPQIRFRAVPFRQLLADGLIETGVLDGHCQLVGYCLKGKNVGLGEIVQLSALGVENTRHITLQLDRHRQLRPGHYVVVHDMIAGLPAHIGYEKRFSRFSHPSRHPYLPDRDPNLAQDGAQLGNGRRFENKVLSLDQ